MNAPDPQPGRDPMPWVGLAALVVVGLGAVVWGLGASEAETVAERKARLAMEAACAVDPCVERCRETRRAWVRVANHCVEEDADCDAVVARVEALHDAMCP